MSVNHINFLPDTFLKERKRQLRVMRESMLIAVVAGLIILWYLVAQGRMRSLENLVGARESAAQDLSRQLGEMTTLDQERKLLVHQLELERELSQPVNLSGVFATLAHFMPRNMALTDMSIQTPIPRPPVEDKAAGDKGKATRKELGAGFPPPVMRISIVGLAASDLDVADFIGKLTQHALFNKVQLAFTRAIELRDQNAIGREFRVELEIRLDRLYIAPASRRGQEVAHVD